MHWKLGHTILVLSFEAQMEGVSITIFIILLILHFVFNFFFNVWSSLFVQNTVVDRVILPYTVQVVQMI